MMSRRVLFAYVCIAGLGGGSLGPAEQRIARAQTTAAAPASSPSTQANNPPPATTPPSAAALADSVPGDVMLYLEIRGFQSLAGSETGAGLAAEFIRKLRPGPASAPARAVTTQTTSPPGLRQLFGTAVGLDNPDAIQLLFSGPLAVAADGWSGLGDAVLIARPANPSALEKALAGRREASTPAAAKVRRYALGNEHELACDGRTAVVGRSGNRKTGLLARTIELLERGGSGGLAEQSEFRDRVAELPNSSQLAVYVGKLAPGGSPAPDPLKDWWPEDWPRLKTIAVGVQLGLTETTIKLSCRLDPQGPQLARTEPPVQIIRHLPASALAVWTHAVDYVGGFRRLKSRYAQEIDTVRFDALEFGLEPGFVEKRLLGHLVGDTVLVADEVAITPLEAKDPVERLVLPTAALMVETDDPDAVATSLGPLAGNLTRLLNAQLPPETPIAVRTEPVVPGGPMMYTVSLGRVLYGHKGRCDLLQSVELSATVADRWLICGTHPQTVRRLVEARRGATRTLAIGDLDRVIEQVAGRGSQPRRVLFAEPRAMGIMIRTWIEHLTRYHPEMLQGQWWDKVLRRQRAMGKQLGILARASEGTVEVVDVLPGGPAKTVLQSGDRILAVDGIKIDPKNSLKSLREYVAERPQADRVELLIRRGQETKPVTLNLPSDTVQGGLQSPVDLLKRFADLSSLFGSASYVLWQPRPDVIEAQIDLRYLSPSPPASHPATAPSKR
jgi:hypothetical protein